MRPGGKGARLCLGHRWCRADFQSHLWTPHQAICAQILFISSAQVSAFWSPARRMCVLVVLAVVMVMVLVLVLVLMLVLALAWLLAVAC